MWDLWDTKWHTGRLLNKNLIFPLYHSAGASCTFTYNRRHVQIPEKKVNPPTNETGADGRAYVSSPCKPSVLCYQTTRTSLSVGNHNHSHRFEHLKSHEMSAVCVALATAHSPSISDLNQRVLERKL